MMLSENEKLALLGYKDAEHSLYWYKENFPNLLIQLEEFIISKTHSLGIFPGEAKSESLNSRYHKYYLILEAVNNRYVVKTINTDRMEIQNEFYFDDLKSAAQCLIRKSFTTAGAIKDYWDCGAE